jgi:hypothetical protein
LDGDGFILQEQGVFTRILSGATLVASGGGACGFSISHAAAEATWMETWIDLFKRLLLWGMKNPKGFGIYL